MRYFGFESEGDEVVEAYGSNIKGKTVVITGASEGGLGAGAAIALAAAGPAHLILTGRKKERVDSVIQEIQKRSPETKIHFVSIFLHDLDDVRRAATEISSLVSKIDVLINNASIFPIPYKTVGNQDTEFTLMVNHLGGFLLTGLLMPKILTAAPGARIVNMTNEATGVSPFRFKDYNFSHGAKYRPWVAYGQSKTANILHAKSLAARYGPKGVLTYAVNPGAVYDVEHTARIEEALRDAEDEAQEHGGAGMKLDKRKTMSQGVATILHAALSPEFEAQNGALLEDCRIAEEKYYAKSLADAEHLWSISEGIVGENFIPAE